LEKFKLNPENLVGIGVDGCSTILGEKKGRLKEISKSLVSFHCPAHYAYLKSSSNFRIS